MNNENKKQLSTRIYSACIKSVLTKVGLCLLLCLLSPLIAAFVLVIFTMMAAFLFLVGLMCAAVVLVMLPGAPFFIMD